MTLYVMYKIRTKQNIVNKNKVSSAVEGIKASQSETHSSVLFINLPTGGLFYFVFGKLSVMVFTFVRGHNAGSLLEPEELLRGLVGCSRLGLK